MKKLVFTLSALFAFSAFAQKNTLLDQSFWQTKPGVEQVKAEIEKGNDPAQLNFMSMDAVTMAINSQSPNETIKFLLSQKGNDITKLTHDGRTYLFWAAARGNVEIAEYLLEKGSDVKVQDSHGLTPVTAAVSMGSATPKIFDLFQKYGADFNKDLNHDGANVLLLATPNDKGLALTDYFVSKGVNLKSTDAAGNTAFNYAARTGNLENMKALLSRGVTYTDNAMIMASQGSRRDANKLEVYQYLESLGIKATAIGKSGENVLHNIARKPNQKEIIEYFISKGVDVNKADEEGNTPFMNAASFNRDIETLTLLLSKVKNINQANNKGATALSLAVAGNSANVVSFLISKGASTNVSDKKGDNLSAYLLQSYQPRTMEDFAAKWKVLEEKVFNFAAAQKNGNTLYHLAILKNDLSLLKRLEGLKIDINAKNSEGITALHKAAMVSKDDAILKYLISLGAKKDVQTGFKETAYDLASENEFLSKNKVSVDFLK